MNKPKKIDAAVVKLLEERISNEFTAFAFYRSAENWCSDKGFFLASAYFKEESEEELQHAKGIEKYITDWNVLPKLPKIEFAEISFASLPEILDKAYKMEYSLYEEYENTSGKVFQMGEFCTFDFLQKYRAIQNESVIKYSDFLNELEGVDLNSKFELLTLEKKLFKK